VRLRNYRMILKWIWYLITVNTTAGYWGHRVSLCSTSSSYPVTTDYRAGWIVKNGAWRINNGGKTNDCGQSDASHQQQQQPINVKVRGLDDTTSTADVRRASYLRGLVFGSRPGGFILPWRFSMV
jgi:hypothetical protein